MQVLNSSVYWGRPVPVVSRPPTSTPAPAPAPVPVPVTVPVRAPLAYPQPAAPALISAPVISPLSGQPVQSSIFHPQATTAVIEAQAQAGPQTGLDIIAGGSPDAYQPAGVTQIPTVAPALNGNGSDIWLVLLVVLAAIIVMVMA